MLPSGQVPQRDKRWSNDKAVAFAAQRIGVAPPLLSQLLERLRPNILIALGKFRRETTLDRVNFRIGD